MHELERLCEKARALPAGTPATLATLVAVDGSAYRRPGARVLLTEHDVTGLVSGGCLEADLAERAQALAQGDQLSDTASVLPV